MLRKAAGPGRDQLSRTTAASDLTPARRLEHLALVEDHWFRVMLLGADADLRREAIDGATGD